MLTIQTFVHNFKESTDNEEIPVSENDLFCDPKIIHESKSSVLSIKSFKRSRKRTKIRLKSMPSPYEDRKPMQLDNQSHTLTLDSRLYQGSQMQTPVIEEKFNNSKKPIWKT
uniref:Uncharacterized protein n=1 Tax=Romanomermis culicivorax TaxID=13658 RepID=A0A915J932_ROMCU